MKIILLYRFVAVSVLILSSSWSPNEFTGAFGDELLFGLRCWGSLS